MIKLIVYLVVLASVESKLTLVFTQNSQELDIRCSLPDDENTTIVNVISLQLTRRLEGRQVMLASVTPFGKPVTNLSTEVVMTSSDTLDLGSTLFLNLHWPRATPFLEGSYKCELRGLDEHNTQVLLTEDRVLSLHNLEPVLTIYPTKIEVGLSESLEVMCSLTDFSDAKLSSVISIEFFRIRGIVDQHLAIASVFYGVEAVSGVSHAEVSGFVGNKNKVNYLKIVWPHPSFEHIGDYVCQVTGLNSSNLPFNLQRIVSLTAAEPPKQLLIDRIHSLEAKNEIASEEIAQLNRHKEELRNNFTEENKNLTEEAEGAKLMLKRVRAECPHFMFFKNVCDFENGMCGFVQKSSTPYVWAKNSGSTGSSSTGPDSDHTSGGGYYLYTESSSGSSGDEARIERPLPANPDIPICINFWYNMYGSAMGRLNIFIKSGDNLGSPVWSRAGDQGNGWKEEFVTVPPSNSSLSLVFEGVRGEDYTSDIAIDDIIVHDALCQ